jgi:hypothetical protein
VAKVNDGIDDSVDDEVLMATTTLTASNTAMYVPCYASTSPDSSESVISGWTTATSSYIKIYTPTGLSEVGVTQRHNGIWDNNKYRLVDAFNIYENYARVEGLQISRTESSGSGHTGVYVAGGFYGERYISKNIIKGDFTGTAIGYGINVVSQKNYITNNIIYNFVNGGNLLIGIYIQSNADSEIHNNTLYNCYDGMFTDNNADIAKNNVIFNSNNDIAGTFSTFSYNASDDGDGDNPVSLGSSTAIWARTFVDYQNYDFRIKNARSVLYDAGTTVSIVEDDIIGTSRPQNNAYDIGALEFTAAPKYRFNGSGSYKLRGHFEFK